MKNRSRTNSGRRFRAWLACGLLVWPAASLAGCSSPHSPANLQPANASLAEQIRAVRDSQTSEIRLDTTDIGGGALAQLHDLPGLKKLILEQAPPTDDDLAQLKALPALEEVRILGGHVGDLGLAHLCGFKTLRRLNLSNTQISDTGLEALRQLPDLMQLRLGSRQVTDAGMDQIRELASLRFLHLIDMPLTDSGLDKLREMTQLESFYLDGVDGVSDEGIDRLLAALPNVHFHRDQQHRPGDPNADDHHPIPPAK